MPLNDGSAEIHRTIQTEHMSEKKRYRRKAGQCVTAIQLDLDFDHFTYRKWGDQQQCEPGDWLVDNAGDVYTVKNEVFTKSYRAVPDQKGRHKKVSKVWAKLAREDGFVETNEGRTHYRKGDYIVANDPDWNDVYAMTAEDFLKRYDLDE